MKYMIFVIELKGCNCVLYSAFLIMSNAFLVSNHKTRTIEEVRLSRFEEKYVDSLVIWGIC